MYQAIIARIKTRPHPNADRLQLADVCGTTVVVGLNHQNDELGVYFPTDGVLSHEFCLANHLYNKSARQKLGLPDGPAGFFDHHRRVRAQSFRGEKSDGFWLPLSCLGPPQVGKDSMDEGAMFDHWGGVRLCEKWTTKVSRSGGALGSAARGRKGELPGFPKHMDTEQWFYYEREILNLKSPMLTFTEKIHGTSHRVGLVKDQTKKWWQFWKPDYRIEHGSRNVVLTDRTGDTSFYGTDAFRYGATKDCLAGIRKGEVLYGEIIGSVAAGTPIMPAGTTPKEFAKERAVYGDTITWTYGLADGHCEFVLYRVVQFNEDAEAVELSHAQVVRRAKDLGLRVVPTVGSVVLPLEMDDDFRKMLRDQVMLQTGDPSAPSLFNPAMPREGVVIRVDTNDGHTKFYKNKSFFFKVLEGIAKIDDQYQDVEENA